MGDAGQWECEVGAVTGEDFKTATANINLEIKVKPTRQKQFEPGEITSRQEVGNDVILHCSADREVHLCRWKTPYLNTYIVGEGIYVERGRIQWLGKDPNYDCTIRVANLDLRDAGTWVCEIGSSTKESFQVQTKEFVIDIETPLKLSAPTALMQNANTDATLVCHANKPYDECLWTTPYGKTYRFPDQTSSHEKGRIAYFGFADTDCGIIVRNVQPKDNGGWQCQLHARNGEIFQNATDIVSLFAEPNAGVVAQPRSIADYDYKSIDYDDFEFDRVQSPAQQRPTKIQLIPNSDNKPSRDSTTPRSQTSSIVNLSDFRATSSGLPPPIELSKLTPKGGTTTSVAPPLSVLQGSDSSDFAGVNPLELELLSRISGTRRDSRPIPIGGSNRGGGFESTRTTSSTTSSGAFEQSTKSSIDTMRQLEIQRIRDERRKSAAEERKKEEEQNDDDSRRKLIVENNRLAERRRKMEEQRRKDAEANEKLLQAAELQRKEELQRKRKEELERERKEELERQRKEELEQQRKEEMERKRKEEQERRRKEEQARRRKVEQERRRKMEAERRRKQEAEERRKKEEAERQRKIEEEKKKKEEEEEERIKKEEERQRKLEEEMKKKEEEDRKQKELERKRKEEQERRRKIEEERRRKQEVERRRKQEAERQRKIEEEKKKKEEARKKAAEERRQEAERKKKEEEERKAKEAEIKRQLELERKRKEEEARRLAEIERKRDE